MAQLTYPLPSTYPITRPFGDRSITLVNHLTIGPHTGIDFGAPVGTPVLAAGAGVVTRAGYVDAFGGRMVYLVHDAGGLETRYAHLGSTSVTAGQHVSAGQQIGTSDTSGAATGPHLHFEVIAHGAASCGLVAQGGLCFEDPAPYVGAGAGATPAGVGATSGASSDSTDYARTLTSDATRFIGKKTWREFANLSSFDLYGVAGFLPQTGQWTAQDVLDAAGALRLLDTTITAADIPRVVGGAVQAGGGTFQPLKIILPPLLEPAISIGVLLAGALLVWQGFREVLNG